MKCYKVAKLKVRTVLRDEYCKFSKAMYIVEVFSLFARYHKQFLCNGVVMGHSMILCRRNYAPGFWVSYIGINVVIYYRMVQRRL